MRGKRSAGEGSIRKLPSGTWVGQVMDGYTDDGKRRMRNFSAPTKAEVLEKIRIFHVEKDQPAAPQVPDIPFAEWADRWYAAYRTQVEESTYSSYRYTIALLKQYFGGRKLSEVKSMEINQFINHLLASGYSSSQISKCRSMLIQLFDAAEADDLVARNYARKSFRGSAKKATLEKRKKKDSFTPEEFHLLMDGLDEDLLGYSIRLLLVTGLRMQELLALTPSDIAEDGSAVTVNKAVKTVDGQPKLGAPKSVRSIRTIPIAEKYRFIALWLRENGGQAYLWCSTRDNLLCSVGTVRRQYYRALKAVPGVRPLAPHCCRHTYVSLLHRQEVPLETIARLTGHRDLKTTDGYLHIRNDELDSAVTHLERV